MPWEPISFGGQCAKTVNCATSCMHCKVLMPRGMVPHVVTRLYLSPWGCAISLIQFARSYTPIYCKGTMFRRGTHLITVISPNCYAISLWNVIIWWNLKACQCEGRSKRNEYATRNIWEPMQWPLNILQEIWQPRLKLSTPFKWACQYRSMALLNH